MLLEEKHLSEIAARGNLSRTQLQNWKREFIENATLVFAQNKVEKEAKQRLMVVQEREDELMKKVGQLTIENDWLKKSLPKLLEMYGEKKLVSKDDVLPLTRQCELLGVNRSSVYYQPTEKTVQQLEQEELIKSRLDFWHT